jgi:hypothetical protein
MTERDCEDLSAGPQLIINQQQRKKGRETYKKM